MGDLNYRVDKFTYDETVAMVGEGNCHILAQVRHAPHTPTEHVTPDATPPISHASPSPPPPHPQEDQLKKEMSARRVFAGFQEAGEISAFAPTYKYVTTPAHGEARCVPRASTRVHPSTPTERACHT